MHPSDQKRVELLSRLLRLHTSRFSGYQVAAQQTDVSVLQVLFGRCMEASAECSAELCRQLYMLGGKPDHLKLRGTYELAWQEINNALCTADHVSIMNACYSETHYAYKLYEYILRVNGSELGTALSTLFSSHRDIMMHNHSMVSNLRGVLLDAA